MDQKQEHFFPIFAVIAFASLVTLGLWWSQTPATRKTDSIAPTQTHIFSKKFPNHDKFISEVSLLKSQGKLTSENEAKILSAIAKTSPILSVPPSLLYCLLFQESRLDHLLGLDENSGALGLGQFSYYSFFEINHELTNFSPKSLTALEKVLGYDARPILANSEKIESASSYFNIPTAVVASAIYLNNRFNQLSHLIEKRQLPYDTNLVWILSAMAYNKGTRSILSLWNQAEEKHGKAGLESFLSQPKFFIASLSDESLLTESLKRIWPAPEAKEYAKEWKIHASNIIHCSTENAFLEKKGVN